MGRVLEITKNTHEILSNDWRPRVSVNNPVIKPSIVYPNINIEIASLVMLLEMLRDKLKLGKDGANKSIPIKGININKITIRSLYRVEFGEITTVLVCIVFI